MVQPMVWRMPALGETSRAIEPIDSVRELSLIARP